MSNMNMTNQELDETIESFYNGNFSYMTKELYDNNVSKFDFLNYMEENDYFEMEYITNHFNNYFWLSLGQDLERLHQEKYMKQTERFYEDQIKELKLELEVLNKEVA